MLEFDFHDGWGIIKNSMLIYARLEFGSLLPMLFFSLKFVGIPNLQPLE
jgi:hypothetical protein